MYLLKNLYETWQIHYARNGRLMSDDFLTVIYKRKICLRCVTTSNYCVTNTVLFRGVNKQVTFYHLWIITTALRPCTNLSPFSLVKVNESINSITL